MADSNITKRALAAALKDLMKETSFEKISVGDICERCDMNRKSFYYHFRDKYDLVNWIFDIEFIAVARKKEYDEPWELLADISEFFYKNREFYRRALCIKGQNSFSDHFRDLLLVIIEKRLPDILQVGEVQEFQRNFFADAFVMAFQRWILEYTAMGPEEFLQQIKGCMHYLAISYEGLEERATGNKKEKE